MPAVQTVNITGQFIAVLREALEGPQHTWTYFTDNQPGAGLFGTIDPLSPADASRPLGKSGTSIAGHVHHLAFSLHASAAWIRGERQQWNWDDSWRIRTVTAADWTNLRGQLRQAYTELTEAIERHALASEEALGGAVGAIAHVAYHLAAIRQKASEVRADGQMGRWADGQMGRWADGQMGRWAERGCAQDPELTRSLIMTKARTQIPAHRPIGPSAHAQRTNARAQMALLPAPSAHSAHLPILEDARARGTTFHEVPVKAILNSPATTGMGFWSLNPYVGCEFGCTYCYARETHQWVMERAGGQTVRRTDGQNQGQEENGEGEEEGINTDPRSVGPSVRLPPWLAFEKRILVKTTAAAVLTRTLFPSKLAGCSLVIGTATDPYQPAERKFRLTHSVLEALLGWRGLSLGIITKSPLVLRDLSLLQQLAQRHELSVNISLSSTDAPLLRRIEARSPAPHARLRALKGLTDGGIHAGLLVAPIIPGITDSRESLAALMAAGKAAGARYVFGSALRLGPAARFRFLPHLAQEFPELVERYTRRYGHSQSPGKDYTNALSARLRRLQQEFGFPVSEGMRRRQQLEGRRPRAVPVAEQWTLL